MPLAEITICVDDEKPQIVDISICVDEEKKEIKDISLCTDDDQSSESSALCGSSGPLVISGTETPSIGSFFSATGGVAPYSYSISCGTINSESGGITDLSGCCGTGTVSVTDACGTTASMEIRFSSGQWDGTWDGNCSNTHQSAIDYALPEQQSIQTCVTIFGGTKTTEYYGLHNLSSIYGTPHPGCVICSTCWGATNIPCWTGGDVQYKDILYLGRFVEEWVCG